MFKAYQDVSDVLPYNSSDFSNGIATIRLWSFGRSIEQNKKERFNKILLLIV